MKGISILAFGLVLGASVSAATFSETEGNDSKAAANLITWTSGDNVTGSSTSTSGTGLDYFRLSTSPLPLGIYRHRIVLSTLNSSVASVHRANIRGLTQTAGVPNTAESDAQTDTTLPSTTSRWNQYYGFGKSESIYYRVTGAAGSTTTPDYSFSLVTEAITPVDLGNFAAGEIRITTVGQGHTTDTDLWIYDGNLNAIPGYGNDDEAKPPIGTDTNRSLLIRNYAPGTYYIALSRFNLENNLGSPADDDFRTAAVLDFPDAVLTSNSTTTNENMAFAMTDALGLRQFSATKNGAYDVYWGKFTVVPEPGTIAAVATGLVGLLGIRRRKK